VIHKHFSIYSSPDVEMLRGEEGAQEKKEESITAKCGWGSEGAMADTPITEDRLTRKP
jgi:hypothetical protein